MAGLKPATARAIPPPRGRNPHKPAPKNVSRLAYFDFDHAVEELHAPVSQLTVRPVSDQSLVIVPGREYLPQSLFSPMHRVPVTMCTVLSDLRGRVSDLRSVLSDLRNLDRNSGKQVVRCW